jgi:hypothetical protein
MAAIEPEIQREARFEPFLRRVTRLAVVSLYLIAAIVAIALVRPAFRDDGAAAVTPRAPSAPLVDTLHKGETVGTFAARHGLDLGELLALNPNIDSLRLPAGTKLRIG